MCFRPQDLRYDATGVPILSFQEIETIATEVLNKHCKHVLSRPSLTPVLDLIHSGLKRTGLTFDAVELGFKNGNKILGRISFTKKLLSLDKSVISGDRTIQLPFTAAHEIGHWILHRWNYQNWQFRSGKSRDEDLDDDEKTLSRTDKRTPQEWLEWQANVFAASLIMPRETFSRALHQIQQNLGITQSADQAWIQDATTALAEIYQVSRKSIQVRIETLRTSR